MIDLNTKTRSFYHANYPTDNIYLDMNKRTTFADIIRAIYNGDSIYIVLGVGDSVVRERIFMELENILKTIGFSDKVYDFLYKKWETNKEA